MHEVSDACSEDSELEVWDESAVEAVEKRIRMNSLRREQESVTQWGNAYFRPGTAPEAERIVCNSPAAYNDSAPKKAALSSPPTSLSEVNFALRSAARQAQNHCKASSRPPSGTQGHDSASKSGRSGDKRDRGLRSGSAAGVYASPSARSQRSETPGSHASPSGRASDGPMGSLSIASPARDDRPAMQGAPRHAAGIRVPTATLEGSRKTIRSSASRKSDASKQERRTLNAAAGNSPQSRPPPKPASPAHAGAPTANKSINVSKQRKAASARLARPELPIHALYSQVYQEEGAPVPQSHPQMFFQKRSRPPSRHRSPQDSLGLDVQPQSIPARMRSAHYPSHHERPPSRCKPPPEALHLEDAASDEEEPKHHAERPSSSRPRRGPTPRPDQTPLQPAKRPPNSLERPVSGTPSRTACQGEFDRPVPNPQTPEPAEAFPDEEEDLDTSSDENDHPVTWGMARSPVQTRSHVSASMHMNPAMASRKKPPAATVPFRTSLSPDFLRLFAPSSSAAPPTPPKTHMVFNNHHRPQEDCMTMGLTDIPSPTDDLFGPFADKELFNKTFEDLCISDDDSEQSI